MSIKALIFDFGGVLSRTENHNPRIELAKRFGLEEHDLEKLVFASPSSKRASIGELSVDDHWREVALALKVNPDEVNQIRDQFFAGDQLDQELVIYLRQMGKTYKIGLLSNAWGDLRSSLNHSLHILNIFDDVVISSEIGIMKPDQRIFLLAAEKLQVANNQVIFVDDTPENVDAARSLGMFGIQFQTTKQTLADISKIIEKSKNASKPPQP